MSSCRIPFEDDIDRTAVVSEFQVAVSREYLQPAEKCQAEFDHRRSRDPRVPCSVQCQIAIQQDKGDVVTSSDNVEMRSRARRLRKRTLEVAGRRSGSAGSEGYPPLQGVIQSTRHQST